MRIENLNITDTYLSLVRAALWGGETLWPVEETERLLRLHCKQGTATLVFPHVLSQEDIPPQTRTQMKGICLQNMQQQVHLQHILSVSWKALEKAGIQAVLMKGAGLAALYPELQQRAWGDIDLFVGQEQYHQSCAVMRETFPEALKFDEELDHYKHYNLIADGVSIEIHRVTINMQHPIDARRYARMEKEGMNKGERISIAGLEVTVPDPTFNAMFVMMHSWEHMTTNGANMRQICDVALLLHHYAEQIDRQQLKRNLNALHFMDVWQLFMWICVHGLGLPREKAPFYTEQCKDRAERLMEDLLTGRMMAPKSSTTTSKVRIIRKFHTMQERMKNAQRIRMYSPSYARHMVMEILLHGATRFFAKDRHWE